MWGLDQKINLWLSHCFKSNLLVYKFRINNPFLIDQMALRQAAVPAAQATIDDTKIEEIDRELGDVCDESSINEPRQIPLNMTIEQEEEVHGPEDAEEEEDKGDTDNVNSTYYFSIEQKKSKFL